MKPILFNTEMVRAILDGRKTVTRRAVKPQPEGELIPMPDGSCWPGYFGEADSPRVMRPPYFIGDKLYVRETWALHSCNDRLPPSIPCKKTEIGRDCYIYRADDMNGKTPCGVYPSPHLWSPSIHMPKEAARLFLRVTGVRVERLQDITEEQAIQEGVYQLPDDGRLNSGCWTYSQPIRNDPFGKVWSKDEGARNCFRWLWESTVKASDRDHYGWIANPWVWVIEFERTTKEN